MHVATRRSLLSRRAAASGNWWEVDGQTCVAAYQPIGAADLATSYVNLANPGTYDAAPGTAPTFAAATGWTFDGATQYLSTGIVVGTSRSYSMLIRYSDGLLTAPGWLAGAVYGKPPYQGFGLVLDGGNDLLKYVQGGIAPGSSESASGVMGVVGAKGYFNGVDENITIPDVVDNLGFNIYIGARSLSGVPNTYYSGKIQAVAIYSTTLSPADVAALTKRMAALS